MGGRVAVLVDGDNIGAQHSGTILGIGRRQGQVDVARVYGDASKAAGWHAAAGFRFVHAGTGKNATDMLLAIEAMELALGGGVSSFVVASSDADFSHLAHRLRERGLTVVGTGEAKTTLLYRAACSRFELLGGATTCAVKSPEDVSAAGSPAEKVTTVGPSALDREIKAIIATHSTKGQGMRIAELAPQMHSKHGVMISTLPERTWRAYFQARTALYDLDPRGPEAKVRFKPQGFATPN
ncbi:NYN domain-containing protein [Palleronia sp. KMU-117]|uniref:NYN domain-containing protein n=1 Tax=Palleronia sp. KMU-117 TaxID=3434108 RepID=UPI003D74F321